MNLSTDKVFQIFLSDLYNFAKQYSWHMNYLKLKIIVSFIFLFSIEIIAVADGEVPSLSNNPNFEKIKSGDSFLCVGTKSVGYDWVNGRWEGKNFTPDKWIIKKLPKDHEYCNLRKETDGYYEFNGEKIWNLRRCYSFKSFQSGGKLGDIFNTGVCYESYRSDMTDGVAIQCAGHIFQKIAFSPNGVFFVQSGNPTVPPKNNKNIDSVFMETGNCSSM